jgi:uncharacterized protein with HEPN domain
VPPRDWRIRIEDIVEAASAIAGYVQGLSHEEFAEDRKTEEVRARFPELPWPDMADMRNVLIHEYFGVDLSILWKTASVDLPAVLPALRRVLEGS